MDCENKNRLLDLYFNEGDESELEETRKHTADCENCRSYIASLQSSLGLLEEIEEEAPSADVFDDILTDISESVQKPAARRPEIQLTSILQIAFGEIFLFGVIYFISVQIKLMPVWIFVQNNWLVKSFGSSGIAVFIVLIAGAFITLSLAPVLLFESNNKRIFR